MANFHSINAKASLQELKSATAGLTQAEADKRLKKHGPNELPKEKPLGKLSILASQFNNALVYILLIAGILSVVLGAKIDAGVIFGAVLINVIIGFIQENKANRAVAKLKQMVEHKALVMRGGQEIMLDSRQIVAGDIVLIKAGNRIPADARMIEAIDLQVDEAALTGESMPSRKNIEPVAHGASLADRENMVYAGTMAVHGLGRAAVVSIGQNTELGKIAEMVKSTKEEKTPLQRRLSHFSRQLGILFGVICLIIVAVGLAQGREFLEMVEIGVAIGVASIPEGLIVAVTFILALGMQQILKKKALTRKLVAAETLGSTTVICSDKTGTLTEGKMHVAHIVIGAKEFEVKTPGSRQDEKEARVVSLALQTAMMCNDAIVENPRDELSSWRIIGSPTEAALLSAAVQSGLRKEELLKIEPQIDEKPFDSDAKYMLSLHQKKGDGYILYEKGAPEKILEKSTKFYHQGKIASLTSAEILKLKHTYENLTSQGLRVIGLAVREFKQSSKTDGFVRGSIDWPEIDQELTFIGFIAIKDPLRPEAKETIKICQQAGIRPIIITGDHELTARTIAGEIGLKVEEENVITGEKLDKIGDDDFKKLIKKISVYARVSPHHKLRIVKALQDQGEVVAMTGDGINDSPALKAADIGISLGTATDIAKETSDIVLLDNNFKTIVAAVKQGRIIFKNIRKVITYLISDSFSEMILVVGAILAGAILGREVPLAVLPAQILWINIVNDGLPDFSLAMERDHGTVMDEKPIRKDMPLLNKEMKLIIFVAGIIRDLFVLALFFFFWHRWQDSPDSIAYLQTLMFVILGIKSLFSIFSIRSFHTPVWKINPLANKYLLGAVSVSLLLLLCGVYWGPLQMVLSTVSLDLWAWMIAIAVGLFSVALVEAVKYRFIIKK